MTRQSDQSPEGRDRSGGLDAKRESPVTRSGTRPNPCFPTPNPILEGVELREAYARVSKTVKRLAKLYEKAGKPIWKNRGSQAINMYCQAPMINRPDGGGFYLSGGTEDEQALIVEAVNAMPALLEALKATPLIGLSQGEEISGQQGDYDGQFMPWHGPQPIEQHSRRFKGRDWVPLEAAIAALQFWQERDWLHERAHPLSGLSLPGRDADADSEIVALLRDRTKALLGGNATFADDDVHILIGLARRAVEAGLTDGLNPSVLKSIRLSTVQDGSVREALAWARNALESIERASETVCAATSSATYEMRLKDCGVNALIDLDQARELCRQAAARAESVLSAPQSGDKI